MQVKYLYQDNLQSTRIQTRFLTLNDIPAWAEFFKDKEAIEFLSTYGLDSELDRAGHWIGKQILRYAEHRFGLQALIEKKTNRFIGMCGLIAQEVEGKIEIEVGYHVFKKYWGQGFAPEAAKIFIDYAFKNDLTSHVISIINTVNFKSQRVAEKNGLKRMREIKWSDQDVYIYGIEKRELGITI